MWFLELYFTGMDMANDKKWLKVKNFTFKVIQMKNTSCSWHILLKSDTVISTMNTVPESFLSTVILENSHYWTGSLHAFIQFDLVAGSTEGTEVYSHLSHLSQQPHIIEDAKQQYYFWLIKLYYQNKQWFYSLPPHSNILIACRNTLQCFRS